MKSELLSIAARLSNNDLIAQVKHLARHEREATTMLVAHLAEFDERRLYLGEGCTSLFAYCVEVLHLSESAAYGRIQAARAARKFPVVLEQLAAGALNLTSLGLLAPHLTAANHEQLLAAASHKSKRRVEELVAGVRPLPDVPASIRKQSAAVAQPPTSNAEAASPEPEPAHPTAVPSPPRAVITPLAPERYKIQFTASAETHAKLRRLQDLLRHQIPNGDPAVVIDRALSVLLAQVEKTKLAAVTRARSARPARPAGAAGPARPATPAGATPSGSRYISAAVRREVWKRDGGRCVFQSPEGRHCGEQGWLEFHHVEPHGDGGLPSLENIQLRCRAHNQYEADLYFGPWNPVVRESPSGYFFGKRMGLIMAGPTGPGPSCGANLRRGGRSGTASLQTARDLLATANSRRTNRLLKNVHFARA